MYTDYQRVVLLIWRAFLVNGNFQQRIVLSVLISVHLWPNSRFLGLYMIFSNQQLSADCSLKVKENLER